MLDRDGGQLVLVMGSMAAHPKARGRLYRKYAVYFIVLVTVAVLTSGATGLYFAYQENRAGLLRLQQEKASGAAARIEQFIAEIEHQIGWTHLPPAAPQSTDVNLRYEYLKLLRQVPAITEVGRVDGSGRERLRVSRLTPDAVDSGEDLSQTPAFLQTRSGEIYFGPVYFRKETEPYMTIAVPNEDAERGVTVVDVNLKFVWDVVSQIKIGQAGRAYAVDAQGRLISHPNISLVLQKKDLSEVPQIRAALETLPASSAISEEEATTARDLSGVPVLTAHATIPRLGWIVFVEQPRSEAFAPLNSVIFRTGLLLLVGLVLAVGASLILARKMVTPIRALQTGAAEIGAGALDYRIDVRTGDEVETLAEEFNDMAARLQESYADLEKKVEERTAQLELANQAKSRLFAAASHDLRQPMHALGLFIAQLRDKVASPDALKVVRQAQASVEALGQLFDAMLDLSKLDAGVLSPRLEDFSISILLQRMENDFTPMAARKGLELRVVPSTLVVRSDPVLLERILLNLVANAVRYTSRGGVLLGCRRRGSHVRIEVRDSGSGVPKELQHQIFQEFYQLANPERDRGKGLGLGLAIVQRLAALLEYRIELVSEPGKGSVFAVEVPIGEARGGAELPRRLEIVGDNFAGAMVAIVDDDTLIQQGMQGLLTGWGCHVITAASSREALAKLEAHDRLPDAIVCDYRLPDESGIEAIERLRADLSDDIPAALISGETAPELLRKAKESGYPLLHKPVQPAKVRALLSRMLSGAGKAA